MPFLPSSFLKNGPALCLMMRLYAPFMMLLLLAFAASGCAKKTIEGTQVYISSAPPPVPTKLRIILSDEQNFAAVTERETIQTDAQRLAANRLRYNLITPSDLPDRPALDEPNIIAYALATNNPVGRPLYKRKTFRAQEKYHQHCPQYASDEDAQRDFLRLGGPMLDKRGLDPDGDGFACGWNPDPFRIIIRKARRSKVLAPIPPTPPNAATDTNTDTNTNTNSNTNTAPPTP